MGYVFDVSPPVMQQSILIVTEAVQPIQIARGVSVPIRVVMIAFPEIVVTSNYSGIICISNTTSQPNLLVLSINKDDASVDSNTSNIKASSNSIYSYRAREKI